MRDADRVAESFDKAMDRILARLPPERRLAGLAPEQRLAALTEAQAVLALPDAVLRGLSNEYLATLPKEARAAIRKRLAPPTRPPDGLAAPARPAEEGTVGVSLASRMELRFPGWSRLKDADLVVECFDRAGASLLARMPLEQRLAGLTPAQRLAGLTEAQIVLALPDAVLRGLTNEYLATLPRATRAAIRKRIGGRRRPPGSEGHGGSR
jgi:hypothetical protein